MNPPAPVRAPAGFPLWAVIGPGLGAMTALYLLGVPFTPMFLLTVVRDFDVGSGGTLLAVWLFPVAALLTAVIGALLGGRYPASVGGPAAGVAVVGELLCGFAPNIQIFNVGRVVAGLGAGVLVAGAVAVAARVRPRRGLALGLVIGLGVLSLVLGAVVSGPLTTMVSWRIALMAPILPLVVALGACVVTGIVASRTPAHPPYGPPPGPPPGPAYGPPQGPPAGPPPG